MPTAAELAAAQSVLDAYNAEHGTSLVMAEDVPADELNLYRREARDAAADAGRGLRLIAQLHDALREAPRTPKVAAAFAAVDAEARRSPWLAEQMG